MAAVQVADRYLRRFVVRVQEATGRSLGSGVLVAPGWVLTCAHVVEGLEALRVVPDRGAGLETDHTVPQSVDATVVARSPARDQSSDSAFWPFPDLALVKLSDWSAHVCAPLVGQEPVQEAQPHAWGFARREDDVPAVGSPASFVFVGVEDEGYLSLKAGAAAPGLSGAPLVCPAHRGVVAVMSVSRAPREDRGGWASPVAALSEQDTAGEELARHGQRVLTLNRDAAWRTRDIWARVLPVPGARDLLERPWDEAVISPSHTEPSTMLRAEYTVVPYLFREKDLAEVHAWCAGPERLSIRYLQAAGGAGKTRFAIQACQAQEARGWVAGLEPVTDLGVDTLSVPRLLVVDYVEERDAPALAGRLALLHRSSTVMAPVRVLLLARPPTSTLYGHVLQPLREVATGAALSALDAAATASAAGALTLDQRGELFHQALAAFGRTWHGPSWTPPVTGVLLADERYSRPLDVLFEAFDAALSGPGWRPGARPPVERALAHEVHHWTKRMPGFDAHLLSRCVALATLAGARDDAQSHDLLDLVPTLSGESAAPARRAVHTWLSGLYEGADRWNPLRPDRLGEALITRTLSEEADHGHTLLTSVLALTGDSQVERGLEVLTRMAGDPQIAPVAAGALAARYTPLVTRCAQQAHGTPERPGHTGLLDALARAHTALLTGDRIADLDLDLQTRISAAADTLGELARDHGRSREALAIFTTALTIDEHKHALEPGNTTYRRDLSISYERLADLALAEGRSGDAEELYRQALTVRQELAELEPGNTTYRRDLSVSYERLAMIAFESGQVEEARRCLTLALNARRELHQHEPQRVDLAEELGVTLYLFASLGEDPTAARQEITEVLVPFERAGTITGKGVSLLDWAR